TGTATARIARRIFRDARTISARGSLLISSSDRNFNASDVSDPAARVPELSIPNRRLATDPRLRLFELARELDQRRFVAVAPTEHRSDWQALAIPMERKRDRRLPGYVVNGAENRKGHNLFVEQHRGRTHEVDSADPQRRLA